jgi:tellurite resistance protein
MVAFSDGEYDKREQVRMHAGLASDDVPAGVNKTALVDALPGLEEAFRDDYETAAEQVLETVTAVRGIDFAKKGIMQAARIAVIANQAITPQEDRALNRIAVALGKEEDVL